MILLALFCWCKIIIVFFKHRHLCSEKSSDLCIMFFLLAPATRKMCFFPSRSLSLGVFIDCVVQTRNFNDNILLENGQKCRCFLSNCLQTTMVHRFTGRRYVASGAKDTKNMSRTSPAALLLKRFVFSTKMPLYRYGRGIFRNLTQRTCNQTIIHIQNVSLSLCNEYCADRGKKSGNLTRPKKTSKKKGSHK